MNERNICFPTLLSKTIPFKSIFVSVIPISCKYPAHLRLGPIPPDFWPTFFYHIGMKNHLSQSTSPYLLQHAENPVDWHPWEAEAFRQARESNQLVIVSIGYSTCHWCHVMAHEVFEDPHVAEMQNKGFVSIKVDREERPDVDNAYMQACRILTGQGGWPLNVFCLPDGRPIHAVTYLPKESWISLLGNLKLLWLDTPERIENQAQALVEAVQGLSDPEHFATLDADSLNPTRPVTSILRETWSRIAPQIDMELGGTLGAPKFPLPTALDALQDIARLDTSEDWRKAMQTHVETTLDAMAMGGIHDQIGGGFFRYSTDAQWHIPHFEKMLYDNAQLLSLYAKAYAHQPKPLWKQVIRATIAWSQNALRNPQGLWFSALDADSPGGEGATYAWTQNQVMEALAQADLLESLGDKGTEEFLSFYDISHKGNWENGTSIPRIPQRQLKATSVDKFTTQLHKFSEARQALLHARNQRPQPATDHKVILEWNALMAKAYLDAGRSLDDAKLLSQGLDTLDAIFLHLKSAEGSFSHSVVFENGTPTAGPQAFLADLAQLAEACHAAFEVTLQVSWLDRAETILIDIMNHHGDTQTAFFRTTSTLGESLFASPLELQDDVTPAANSTIARNLHRIGTLREYPLWTSHAASMIAAMRDQATGEPLFHANWLRNWLALVTPVITIRLGGPEATRWSRIIWSQFPSVIIGKTEATSPVSVAEICAQNRCLAPVFDLRSVLETVGKIFTDFK